MSICIGEKTFISKENIIAVLDGKSVLKSEDGKALINKCEKKQTIHHIKGQIKTYVLTFNGHEINMYESNISSTSIKNKFKPIPWGFEQTE